MERKRLHIVCSLGKAIHSGTCLLLLCAILISTNIVTGLFEYFDCYDIELTEKWEKETEEEKKEVDDNEEDKILTRQSQFFFARNSLEYSKNDYCFADKVHSIEIPTPPPEFS